MGSDIDDRRLVGKETREAVRDDQRRGRGDERRCRRIAERDPTGTFGARDLASPEVLADDRRGCGAEPNADGVKPALDAVADT